MKLNEPVDRISFPAGLSAWLLLTRSAGRSHAESESRDAITGDVDKEMYSLPLLAKDTVNELKDLPQSSVGAPCPMVLADEHHLHVIFYLQETPKDWDGTSVRVVGPDSDGELYAIVTFLRHTSYYHGSPNEEAFSGHPLQKRGLEPYGSFEIKNSSWIKKLMEMNRVHERHKDEMFSNCRHFILSFHDSVFECVARSYSLALGSGSIMQAARKVLSDFQT